MARCKWPCVAFLVAFGAVVANGQITNPIPTPIPTGPLGVELQAVATGLVSPVYLAHAGDGTGRLFIVDQAGLVRLIKNGALQATPFLNVSGLINTLNAGYDERGLLGMAFHPGFADPGSPGYRTCYTYETLPFVSPGDFTVPGVASFNHQDAVVEYKASVANPDVADLATRRIVFRINHPAGNHNAGMIAFGPDGYLYIADGDGGGSNDNGAGHVTGGNAQDITLVLGKILRIDPLHPSLTPLSPNPPGANGNYRIPAANPFVGVAGADEVYAYGLRNPYRFSFDMPTGRLLAGDVGQGSIEEVNIITSGGNFGWRVKEGTFTFNADTGQLIANSPGAPVGMIDPVLQYDHDEGQAVVGGFVYRGKRIPVLEGMYIFGEYRLGTQGRLFYGDLISGEIRQLRIGITPRGLGIYAKGFGQDAEGELYVTGSTNIGPSGTGGAVYRILRIGVPGDIDGDAIVDVVDLLTLADAWASQTGDPNYSPAADLDSDGSVDVVDLLILAENWPG